MRFSHVITLTVGVATAAAHRHSSPRLRTRTEGVDSGKDQYCYGLYSDGVACPIEAAFFDQLIDHDNPMLGTFKQRYWVNAEFYAGPGAPIVLFGPAESAADGSIVFTTNSTINGVLAQENKGAAIVLEHRYWGESSPFEEMTTKNMRHLTLDNAMRDTIYFARNVKLTIDVNGTTHPDRAPWIFSGGSYPGAVAAWINKLYPGTFWAYHAVSAVVQPIANYWQYYVPIEAAMPRNCSNNFKQAIEHIDDQLSNRNGTEKNAFKDLFGLGSLQDDDFAGVLANVLSTWTDVRFNSPPDSIELFQMCDYIEAAALNSTEQAPGVNGGAAYRAVSGLAKWLRQVFLPGRCLDYGDYWPNDPTSIACWNSHNETSPFYTDRSVRNQWNLQWLWMLCNEPYVSTLALVQYFTDSRVCSFQQWTASFPGDTGLVSKHLTMQDERDQCERFFPTEDGFSYGLERGRTTEDIVRLTDGWNNINTTRLVYVNGEYDPWLTETVSSPFRPSGALQSTEKVPVFVVPKATHCPDLDMNNVASNDELRNITQRVISIISDWVGEFYHEKGISRPGF